DDKGNVVLAQSMGIVERMRQELDNPIYKDWLFVLGTAIAASKETKTSCLQSGCSGKIVFDVNKATGRSTPRCSVDRNHNVGEKTLGAFIENVAFIVKEKEVHTVSKELVSHVDFKGHSAGPDRVTLRVQGTDEVLGVERHAVGSGYTSASNVSTKFTD